MDWGLLEEYEALPDLCNGIIQILSAARFSRATTIFDPEFTKTADQVARQGLLTVSVVFILFHWWVQSPKLKSTKLRAAEAGKIKISLHTQGAKLWAKLPAAMRKGLDDMITECTEAKREVDGKVAAAEADAAKADNASNSGSHITKK